MLIPERLEHSLSDKQVPDSSWSLWQAVFWNLSKFTKAAIEGPERWPLALEANASKRPKASNRVVLARSVMAV